MGQCGRNIDKSDCMVDRGCLHSGDLMSAQGLAYNVEPAGERCVTKDLLGRTFTVRRIVATIDFSGLTSSTCALASAAAKLPIELLDCCMVIFSFEEFECDGAGFRPFGAYAMADSLLCIFGHQGLQFGLGFFVLEICRLGPGKASGELRPGIGGAHIDNANRLDPRLWRLDPKQSRRLAIFDTAPEFPLSGDDEVLVERIGMGLDLDPFAAAGNDREHRRSAATTHILCCSCAICFAAAASSENDQGSMNLASKTASLPCTRPSSVAPIQRTLDGGWSAARR